MMQSLRLYFPAVPDTVVADCSMNADPFAEADEDTGETKQSQNYIHIRIQRRCRMLSNLGESELQRRGQEHY